MSIGLITAGIGLVKSVIEGKAKKVQANADAETRQADNRAKIRVERVKNASKVLRFYSYFMFSAPIWVTVLFPDHGARIWTNLEAVPDWYKMTFLSMNGALWALAETHNLYQKIRG